MISIIFLSILPLVINGIFVCQKTDKFEKPKIENGFYCEILLPCTFKINKNECEREWLYPDRDVGKCPVFECLEQTTEAPFFDFSTFFDEEMFTETTTTKTTKKSTQLQSTTTITTTTTTTEVPQEDYFEYDFFDFDEFDDVFDEEELDQVIIPATTTTIFSVETTTQPIEESVTDQPQTEESSTEELETEEPETVAPETEKPATEKPATKSVFSSLALSPKFTMRFDTVFCPDGKRYCNVVAEPFLGKCIYCLEPCDPSCKKRYIVQDTLCPEWKCFPLKQGHTNFWLLGVAITISVIASFFIWWFFGTIKRWFMRQVYERIPGVDEMEMGNVERGVPVEGVNGGGRVATAPPEVQPLVNDLNEGNQPIITNNRMREEVRRFSRRLVNCCFESRGLENENFVHNA